MQKALIALIVCALMVSAFAMTSVASAVTPPGTQVGNSPVYNISNIVDGVHGIVNTKRSTDLNDWQVVDHLRPGATIPGLTGPENYNSNNPNDDGCHPAL